MHDACHRRAATGADVGGGTGDRAGGGEAAEQAARRSSPGLARAAWLGLWRSSIWLSATRAESSDSIAPSSAIVRAGAISLPSVVGQCRKEKGGISCGIPPKRLPMVSTGRFSRRWRRCMMTSTASGPGRA